MASKRCGCASDSCSCVVAGGAGVVVSGIGSKTSPYLIEADIPTDPAAVVDAKGDLLAGTAADTLGRLPVGTDGRYLRADSSQVTGLAWDALTDADLVPEAPNDQTGTAYTFALADRYRMVTAGNASAQTFTVPPNSAVAYPLGTALQVVQKGAGQVTLAPGSGVTLNQAHGLKTSAQWAVVTILKIAADVWVVTGDTTT